MIIHCAGSGLFGPITSQDPTNIKQLIDNNLLAGIFLLQQEAIKRYYNQSITLAVVMLSAANMAKLNESTYCAVK